FENVEPAIAIVITNGQAHSRLFVAVFVVSATRAHGDVGKSAVVVVVEQDARLGIHRDVNVGPTIVIEVVGDGGDRIARSGFQDSGFFGDVGKGAVAVVVEEIVGVTGKPARAAHYGNPFPLARGGTSGIGGGGRVELDVIADK